MTLRLKLKLLSKLLLHITTTRSVKVTDNRIKDGQQRTKVL